MSRGFGQGELLQPPRPRRLIVPPIANAWWGVDPSTLRVSVATCDLAGVRGVTSRPFPSLDPGPRLAEIHVETRQLARELVGLGSFPGVIAVEQPSGKTPNPQLVYAAGVIVAGLLAGVRAGSAAVSRYPVLEMVASSKWKAAACGHGSIAKPQKRPGYKPRPEDYGVLRWARTMGYAGSSWDEADAYGVCDWAQRTFELERR